MVNKYELDTPCLVIDKTKLINNLQTMQNEVDQQNKNLRPHIKTHKSTQLAQLQIDYGAIGVSAAKMGEVEELVKANIPGILITSPVVTPVKIKRLINCVKQSSDILLITDSKQNAIDLNQAAKENQLKLNVLVDINSGIGRTGLALEDAVELAKFIYHKLDGLNFMGLQCYAGNLQHIENFEDRTEKSIFIMQHAASAVTQLENNNIHCAIVTGSGTGTYDIDMAINEVTEVQPGSYTVMDREYQLIGSREDAKYLKRFEPAMTMLVTVISANQTSHVTVDAGTKALYVDAHTKPQIISHPGLHYDWSLFGDEHGKVTADSGVELPKVGEVLELIVPHCDPTINLFDEFHISENDQIIEQWKIDMRGKCY